MKVRKSTWNELNINEVSAPPSLRHLLATLGQEEGEQKEKDE
jgi:hypothetical protein